MLKGSLYTLQDLQQVGEAITAALKLDPEHAIFKGHYPGQPVLPGACMLEMVKEVLSEILNRNVKVISSSQIKFLSMIDPTVNPHLKLTITLSEMKVAATLATGDVAAMKLQAVINQV